MAPFAEFECEAAHRPEFFSENRHSPDLAESPLSVGQRAQLDEISRPRGKSGFAMLGARKPSIWSKEARKHDLVVIGRARQKTRLAQGTLERVIRECERPLLIPTTAL